MDNPNPFLDENLMSREEYRQSLQEHVIIVLERDWHFKILKVLGKGSFGDVFSGTSPNYPGKVAIKITRSDETWEKEKCDWRNLNHPNVMPLLQAISLKQADIFVMPQLSQDLYHILGETRNAPCGFDRVKSWLKDVLVAVDYLHQRKLCHLDIKSDNVMIDFSDRAVLCDFTFLNDTTAPTRRYGIPLIYRPPEACESLGHCVPVDGAKLDIWGFGMLAFSALSGHVILRKLRQMRSWREDIYPFLLYGLKAPQLHALMREAFPASSIADEEVAKAQNFLQTVLRDRAEDRPSAAELLKHDFLANERQTLTHPGDAEIAKDNVSAPAEEVAHFSVLLKNEQHSDHVSEGREKGAELQCAEYGAEAGDNLGFVRANENAFYTGPFADISVFAGDGQYCSHVHEILHEETVPVRPNRNESGGAEIADSHESSGNVLSTALVNTGKVEKDKSSSENNFHSSDEAPLSGLSSVFVESEPQDAPITPAIKWRISSWKAEFDEVFCRSVVLPQDAPMPDELIHPSNSPDKVGKDSTQSCHNGHSSNEAPSSGLSSGSVKREPQGAPVTPTFKWRISSLKTEFDKVFCPTMVLPQDVPMQGEVIHPSNSPDKVEKGSAQSCPKDCTRDVTESLTSEVSDIRNVKNLEVIIEKEVAGHPGSPGISKAAEDAVIKKRKSRKKRVSGWFRRIWTGLWICGSNSADD